MMKKNNDSFIFLLVLFFTVSCSTQDNQSRDIDPPTSLPKPILTPKPPYISKPPYVSSRISKNHTGNSVLTSDSRKLSAKLENTVWRYNTDSGNLTPFYAFAGTTKDNQFLSARLRQGHSFGHDFEPPQDQRFDSFTIMTDTPTELYLTNDVTLRLMALLDDNKLIVETDYLGDLNESQKVALIARLKQPIKILLKTTPSPSGKNIHKVWKHMTQPNHYTDVSDDKDYQYHYKL